MGKIGKKILMAPLDPVHDVGLRLIGRGLEASGYEIMYLPPDTTAEELVNAAMVNQPEVVLVSRTIGYQVGEIVGRLVDLLDAAGLRQKIKLGLGGMAIKPELAAELGFDAGFGPGTQLDEVLAFIEEREIAAKGAARESRVKKDTTLKYSYAFRHQEIGNLLDRIAGQAIAWYSARTSPGLIRAEIREQMLLKEQKMDSGGLGELRQAYAQHCDENMAKFYLNGSIPSTVRPLTREEVDGIVSYADQQQGERAVLQHLPGQPMVFVQYGTGCPAMDIAHIKASESWGADGILHFDPSWSARAEGLLEGHLTQQDTGTLYTPQIIRLIKRCLNPATVWTLRTHRGLNTPETVVMAGILGADMVKINPTYGGLSGGTDPERMLADAIGGIAYAAKYNMAYDIPVGHELSGVPARKTLAGMLIVAAIGRKLGARPILNPLFCYSPNAMLEGSMEQNYVDYNAARVEALRSIMDAPMRAGEPVAFMTHTEERVQSAVTTILHAGLAMSLGVDAITIASTDEAYSGGPITVTSRIDTLKAMKETFRFFGATKMHPGELAARRTEELMDGIKAVLQRIDERGDMVASLYDGLLGDRQDGVYPGRAGKGTVREK